MSRNQIRVKNRDQVLTDAVLESPVDRDIGRRRRRIWWILILLVIVVLVWFYWRFLTDRPEDFASAAEHFKYGSIGAEPGGSLLNAVGGLAPPYWILMALPEICPDLLPGGYEAAGLLIEEDRDRPIGVSRRFRLGIDFAGFNCSVCHTGTYRESPASERHIVLGMPANQLRFQELTRLITECPVDERFTPDNVLGAIERIGGDLDWLDRLIYRSQLIPRVREQTLVLGRRIRPLLSGEVTAWGPGRIDTFNPYKAIQFNWNLEGLPADELISPSDYPSLWNQEPREGMQLHWDGNNDSVAERNLSASLGAGVTPVTIDHERLGRVADWAWTLPPPPYPWLDEVDAAEAARGEGLYGRYCLDCHAGPGFREGEVEGSRVGKVERLADIGTDPHRWGSYTAEFAANQYTLYPDSEYAFSHFRKTEGYANQPLDAIWARAPYLHNGSVPTLRDLLEAPENRPAGFYRGYDVYDRENLGFVSDVASENGVEHFWYDTSLPGNSNAGHLYAIDLPPEDKDAIVEYLKTF